jgi:hypothetical protein
VLENKLHDLKVTPLTVAGFDLDTEEKQLLLTEYSQYEYICSEYSVIVEPGWSFISYTNAFLAGLYGNIWYRFFNTLVCNLNK